MRWSFCTSKLWYVHTLPLRLLFKQQMNCSFVQTENPYIVALELAVAFWAITHFQEEEGPSPNRLRNTSFCKVNTERYLPIYYQLYYQYLVSYYSNSWLNRIRVTIPTERGSAGKAGGLVLGVGGLGSDLGGAIFPSSCFEFPKSAITLVWVKCWLHQHKKNFLFLLWTCQDSVLVSSDCNFCLDSVYPSSIGAPFSVDFW